MEHPSEELEHVEHQKHEIHSQFDRRVAMTMAIVAAVLACVTMLSHRAHNETLRLQTEASDQWNFYQAKNIREHEYRAYLKLLAVLPKAAEQESLAKQTEAEWSAQIDKYKTELPEMQEKAKELQHESHHYHTQAARFDLGELGVELALVLCSLCVLTKRKEFWYGGIAVGIIGAGVSLSGFFLR